MQGGHSAYEACLLPGFSGDPADEIHVNETRRYRVGLALPVCAPPIEDALVVTRGDRIVAIGAAAALIGEHGGARSVVEMPGAVLLPGLVNAHCHLSLTYAHGLLPPTDDFVGWIRKLLPLRGTWSEREYLLSNQAGLRETLRGGCTAIGEIVTEAESWRTLAAERAPLRLRAYREYFGWPRERAEALAAEAAAFVRGLCGDNEESEGAESGDLLPGLSPHAPYTTPPALYEALIELANREQLPMSTHVAETRFEADFMAERTGPFGEIHERLGWTGEPFPWGKETLATWLAKREIRVPLQIVHGTHLSDGDIAALGKLSATVVYCPGSVAHFHTDGDTHPVSRLLAAGVPVALGTDSLASSPTLNLPLTCTLAARAHPELAPETILDMATRAGAESLGLPGEGLLRDGGRADFLLFDLGGKPRAAKARDAIAGAILSGYRVPNLHVFGGRPYGFAALRPFPG